jgi:hypothetical protein
VSEQPERDLYHNLSYYTLTHSEPGFIHQLIVDAFGAQRATAKTKPVRVVFALIGLYLHIEKGYTGRQVQQAHVRLARSRRTWPQFKLPVYRGDVTVSDVLVAPAGPERDAAIEKWSRSVWNAYRESHALVAKLFEEFAGENDQRRTTT